MRQQISLNDGDWLFGWVPRCSFWAANVYDLPTVTNWLPATVPGNVRVDLWAARYIPDPYVGENHKAGEWVEAVDWWYRRKLPALNLTPEERVFACFNGIDYLSAIFADGQQVARHQGMFSRQIIDVTSTMHPSQPELAVRLWGSGALPRRSLSFSQRVWKSFARRFYRSWVGVYADRTATLKAQMSFGWDFAPPIRTMGIWDDVTLIKTGSLFIADVGIRHSNMSPQNGNRGPLRLTVSLGIDSRHSRPVEFSVTLTPANFEGKTLGPFCYSLQPPAGASTLDLKIPLAEIMYWQPWEIGFPHLYHVAVVATDHIGTVLDNVTCRTGFCAVSKQGWQFKINGQPLFLRGVNWVPADIFPGRVRHDDYRRLLTLARDSGVNMLRVWGGGLREKRSFYDLCDELGLLVWQEFPFACEFLGTFPQDHSYLSFVSDECGDIVRQVQPHPSLLAWCGGNEFSRRRNRLLLSTLNRVVKEYDDKRPFIPVSPSVPDGGDAHNWHVWHGESSFNAYQRETARMLSEFGVQALPDARTLSTCLPAPADPSTWPGHYGDPEKIMRYSVLFKEQVNDDLLSTVGGEVLIQQSQLAQAVALQTAIEHMRRQRDSAGGVCLWQFNEPWPAISWAIVDYYGRPKLALRRLAIWYALVLVSLQFEVGRLWQAGDSFSATVWLVNDTALALPGCQIEVNIDGQVIYRQVVDSSPDKVCRVGVIDYKLNDPPRWVEATVTHQQQLLASNQYPLRWADTTLPDHRQRLRRWIAGQVLR